MYRDIPKEATWDIYPRHRYEAAPLSPKFNKEKCTFCMQCVNACLVDAITADKEKGQIDSEATRCYSCGFCAGICPVDAIEIIHTKTGRTVWTGRGAQKTDWVNW